MANYCYRLLAFFIASRATMHIPRINTISIATASHSIMIPLQMQSEALYHINYKEKQICFSVMLKDQKMEKGTKTTAPVVVDVTMWRPPQDDSSRR